MKVAPAPIKHHNPTDEGYVTSGVLRYVFGISRMFGIAPVRIQKTQNSARITVCPKSYAIQVFVMVVLNLATVTGLIWDDNIERSKSVRSHSSMRLIWISDITTSAIVSGVGAYQFDRTKVTLQCLVELQKIHCSLNLNIRNPNAKTEWKRIVIFMAFLVLVSGLTINDYILILCETYIFEKNVVVACLYSTYEVYYIIVFLLEMQFVFSTLKVHEVLKSLNNALEDILENYKVAYTNACNNYRPVQKSIRDLSHKYDNVCSITKKLNDAYSIAVFVLLIVMLTRLITTPFNIVRSYFHSGPLTFVLALPFWVFSHFLCIFMLVEPSHLTQVQMARTRNIVSNLERKFSDKHVSNVLSKFSLYLQLNQVPYSPLGIFTLSRSLISAIVGMVTTYLIIIIQLRP